MKQSVNLHQLEFSQLKQNLAAYCSTPDGRQRVADLRPLDGMDAIERSFGLFREMMQVPRFFDLEMPENNEFVNYLSVHYVFAAQDFMALAQVLRTGIGLKAALTGLTPKRFPALRRLGAGLYALKPLYAAISRVFDASGMVADNASKELRRIRAQQRGLEARMHERLNRFFADKHNADGLQEQFVTTRNDRFVVPVKPHFLKTHHAIVQDRSKSGQTLFVEPEFLVALNNKKRGLDVAEKEEITRILADLSAQVRDCQKEISANMDTIAEVDVLCAVSRVARKQDYTLPGVVQERLLLLKRARHPLLLFSKGVADTIPFDLELTPNTHVAIITGPNTGGKTVTLKTVGLICLLANCGLPAPCGPGSLVPYLDGLMCDIGDEQSIKQSLSTFSAHVSAIQTIVRTMTGLCLVLIDEIGAGTDPEEGSALGMAVLHFLLQQNCLALASTHYGRIKTFGYLQPGCLTASVGFDRETLEPLYRLRTGKVGSSHALYIAEKIGLDQGIIRQAHAFMDKRHQRVEDMIGQIERQKSSLLSKLTDITREKEKIHSLRKQQDTIFQDHLQVTLELEKRKIAELEEWLQRVRHLHRQLKQQHNAPDEDIERELASVSRQVEAVKSAVAQPEPAPAKQPLQAAKAEPGDYVTVKGQEQTFQVLARADKKGFVEIGRNNFRLRVHQSELLAASAPAQDRSPAAPTPQRPFRLEINVVGMTRELALEQVQTAIDDAHAAGQAKLLIVHGKGKGILQQAIRAYLEQRKEVRQVVLGEEEYNNAGVTEAVLA